MSKSPRCLYESTIADFIHETDMHIFGSLNNNYHGDMRTTSREAWNDEIRIMKDNLSRLDDKSGNIIFEYDIPRLGKRIDVTLLYKGIVFCIEFKVGESRILEGDIDQVLDYALDLKNFHKYSEEKVIVPILVATKYNGVSDVIQMSVYDDRIVNPLVTGSDSIDQLITAVIKKYPKAVITGEYAFYVHGLTNVIPEKYDLATPSKAAPMTDPRVRQSYVNDKVFSLGIIEKEVDGVKVRIYDKERMLIELLRKKNSMPYDLYKEIIVNYREIISSLEIWRIQEYAAIFPKSKMISKALDEEVM